MERLLKSGPGWRVGWDPTAPEFKGLVGTDDWALELTDAELDDFCRLLLQVAETMALMREELMDQEAIACEVESDLVWLEANGYPDAYGVQLLLLKGRRGEGHWAAAVVPDLLQAVQQLKVF
jgi:hypothetical protein